jgi:hypothetical protein
MELDGFWVVEPEMSARAINIYLLLLYKPCISVTGKEGSPFLLNTARTVRMTNIPIITNPEA